MPISGERIIVQARLCYPHEIDWTYVPRAESKARLNGGRGVPTRRSTITDGIPAHG